MSLSFEYLRDSTYPSLNFIPRNSGILEDLEMDLFICAGLSPPMEKFIIHEKIEILRRYRTDKDFIPEIHLHFELFNTAFWFYPQKFMPKNQRAPTSPERNIFFSMFDDQGKPRDYSSAYENDSYFRQYRGGAYVTYYEKLPNGQVIPIQRCSKYVYPMEEFKGQKDILSKPFAEKLSAKVEYGIIENVELVSLQTIIQEAVEVTDEDIPIYYHEISAMMEIPETTIYVVDAPEKFLRLCDQEPKLKKYKKIYRRNFFEADWHKMKPGEAVFLNFSFEVHDPDYYEQIRRLLDYNIPLYYTWMGREQEDYNPQYILSSFNIGNCLGYMCEFRKGYVCGYFPLHDYFFNDQNVYGFRMSSLGNSRSPERKGNYLNLYYLLKNSEYCFRRWKFKRLLPYDEKSLRNKYPTFMSSPASEVAPVNVNDFTIIDITKTKTTYIRPAVKEMGELEHHSVPRDTVVLAVMIGKEMDRAVFCLSGFHCVEYKNLPLIPYKSISTCNAVASEGTIMWGWMCHWSMCALLSNFVEPRVTFVTEKGWPMSHNHGYTSRANLPISGLPKIIYMRAQRRVSGKYRLTPYCNQITFQELLDIGQSKPTVKIKETPERKKEINESSTEDEYPL